MSRTWKVYLIHHSHTDIGYTERQDKIARYHSDFICQAIDILNEIHRKDVSERELENPGKGFVWQCENYWQVRNFYATASPSYIQDFEHYVKTGEIGLSGNYLNLTELVSDDVLRSRLALAKEYGEKIGCPVISAMCADINGMAWGYADALYDNGITSLYTCIHPHHGMFPLYQKQVPFYWESPAGEQILVWNGDYYHMGNEMFFAPRGGNTYQIQDEYHELINNHLILNREEADTERMEIEICQVRLERYLNQLEEEDYPYSFVPFMVSGCITDNAPPSVALAKRVNELNKFYAGKIQVEMVNLDQFFQIVKEQCSNIPCYKGDFNDWWADGVGSTPDAMMVYLDARRKQNLCRKLDPKGGDEKLLEEAAENLILYAEHTWGYSSSVVEPWEPLVGELEWKKAGYAVNANTASSKNLDKILKKRGEISICYEKGQRYRIINPHDIEIQSVVYLYIELWEYVEGVRFNGDIPIQVLDCATGQIIPSQVSPTARAWRVELIANLQPGEERDVRIVRVKDKKAATVINRAYIGAEGIADLLEEGERKDSTCVETKSYRLLMNQTSGITSIFDKKAKKELVHLTQGIAPFSGVYEVTKGNADAREIRRQMGRSRKTARTKRFTSILTDIQIAERGEVYTVIELMYMLEGCGLYTIYLKVYEELALIEAKVRIHKNSVWEPENLYVALPFIAGKNGVTWIDKTGCIIRPGIDQLPGTNQDFYLVQNGIVWEDQGYMVMVSSKQAPLISLGELAAGPIKLCNGSDVERNQSPVYSWVMNNYWETNFKAETGGFYEFSYRLRSGDQKDINHMFAVCEADNEGLLGFYVRADGRS